MIGRERSNRFAVACLVAAVVALLDQATKAIALTGLSQDERIPLLGNLLGLQLALNPGAILSLGGGATWLLTLLGIGAITLLVIAAARAGSGWWAVGIGLLLGGVIGNVIDRLFAPPAFGAGYVTDFLAYGNLFIGNLADVALGAGVVVLALSAWHRSRTRIGDTAATAGVTDDEAGGS
ncbi:signal peptidase II [Microbacterium awajiense]|uniref:Lipoprotein signal peptidase n=1 Tax=Microbacterium awajiense TaxID=415214 RepID=A0ABP7AVH6_9MICO